MISLCLALSHHLIAGDWNEIHPCVRLQHEQFIAGAFLNSENSVSAYAGVELTRGDFFLELGAATGYSAYPVVPFGRAGYEINDNARVFVAPAITTDGDVGAVVGVEMSMDIFR